ncbi:MAG TPA: hypothetical protein VJT81_06655 [Burkholderiales bacterium]|nr:hypothetical protein [Burkholderiales bacterium]
MIREPIALSPDEEFALFWKHYGTKHAGDLHVDEARRHFVNAIERQVSLALTEEQTAMLKFSGHRLALDVLRCCLFVLLLPLLALAQPYPMERGEDSAAAEIRLKGPTGTTVKLRKIPSAEGEVPAYKVPSLAYPIILHIEPCWKATGECVVSAVTVKTFLILTLGTRYNLTNWWCKPNSAGECPMPAFATVSVPAGKQLCLAYDRRTAAWHYPPRACTPEDLNVLPPAPTPGPATITPTSAEKTLTTPHGTFSFGAAGAPGGSVILLNNQPAANGSGVRLSLIDGKVYTQNSEGNWYVWIGERWSRVDAPL